jgi:predicted dehydrogenase
MNVGLIGCGRIASAHMTIFRLLKGVQVVAVSDINYEKAKAFANNYGIKKAFTNYVDLFEIKDLDFVDVCTPTSTHVSIVCDAAKFGHNILLEKPMALSTAECERMIHEIERHGVSFCVCHNQLFFPAIKRAKYLVDSGMYNVTSFKTYIKVNPTLHGAPAWNFTPEEKGILWEEGCHPVYLQLHILGSIAEVYAVGIKGPYRVFSQFSVILRTSSERYGIIEVSWLTKESEKVYEIESSDGKRALMRSPPPYANSGYNVLTEITKTTKKGVMYEVKEILKSFAKKESLGYYIGHYYLIDNYINSLKRGQPSPIPPEEGKRTIKLLECIQESLNTNKIVSVKNNFKW